MREDAGKSRFCKPWKVYENTGGDMEKNAHSKCSIHLVGCPYYNAPRSINLTTRSLMHNSSRREDMAQMLSLYAVCRPIVNLWCIKLCCLCLFVHLSCSVTTLSDVQTHKSQKHILGFPLRIFPVFLSM